MTHEARGQLKAPRWMFRSGLETDAWRYSRSNAGIPYRFRILRAGPPR